MFQKIKVIEGIITRGYLLEGEYLIIQASSFLKKIELKSKSVIFKNELPDNVKIQKILNLFDRYVALSNGEIIFLNKELYITERINLEFVGYNIYEEKYLIQLVDYDYSAFLGKYCVYDLSLKEPFTWISESGQVIKVESGIFFAFSKNLISKIESKDGSIVWNYFVNNGNLIPDLLGVASGLLLVSLKEVENIIALEITTGKLVWERKAFAQLYQLDTNGDYLYAISSGYTKIEAKTGEEMDSFIDREYFEGNGIYSQRGNYAITESHIITTDSKEGVIGAFNIETHQFDWIHREEGVSFPAPNPIIYKKPYLLLQDNKSSLHIFKEDLPIVS